MIIFVRKKKLKKAIAKIWKNRFLNYKESNAGEFDAAIAELCGILNIYDLQCPGDWEKYDA